MVGVLIVDDDDNIREALEAALAMGGFTSASVANGQDALRWLGENAAPRLILLDLMMPVMNGWEVLAAMDSNAKLRPIPVVVVTAFQKDLGSASKREVLRKPIDLDQLLDIVGRHCEPKPKA